MNAALEKLEARVATLEKTVHELKASLEKDTEPWWQKTAGMLKDDPVFEEIVREMQKARKADRDAVCRQMDREDQRAAKGEAVRKRERKSRRSAG
jgi:hypothetical protein